MSYDEVAGLLERVTGQRLLSDQTIQQLVVAKAVEVSEQWQSESQADTAVPPLPAVMPQVDWYDPQSEEVLLLTDAIQVKQQKASREQGGLCTSRVRIIPQPALGCSRRSSSEKNSHHGILCPVFS